MTLLALDTATLYYRNFYALPESMTAPDGFPNNAVRGTLTMIAGLVERWQTVNVSACWDADWRPEWRVELVPSYKTHRLADDDGEEEPDTLGPQINAIGELLDALGISRPWVPGYEADDVIASLVHGAPDAIVVTSDRDLVQVIDGAAVRLHLMVNGGMDSWPLLDAAEANSRYGVSPAHYVDMAVLRGDPSDGLPGVPGIGPKTAVALIQHFTTLDGVLDSLSSPVKPLTPRLAQLIGDHATDLQAARLVATAVRTLPVTPQPWESARVRTKQLNRLAQEWGVQSSVDRLRVALEAQDNAAA